MVCIEKRPYTLYGRLATLHFRYLTCLLDRGISNWSCIKINTTFFIQSDLMILKLLKSTYS